MSAVLLIPNSLIVDAVPRLSSYYGYGSGIIFLDQVECNGFEAEMIECSHEKLISCKNEDLAGVFCPCK